MYCGGCLDSIQLAGEFAISAVTGNARGVDAVHLLLHLRYVSVIRRCLEFNGLVSKRARLGQEASSIGVAHRNGAGNRRQIVSRSGQRVGEHGDFIELIELGCRSRRLWFRRPASWPTWGLLVEFSH